MWCRNCNRETNSEMCELCGGATDDNHPFEIYWCWDCRVPLIKAAGAADKNFCPTCGGKATYLCADLRPVFPEERLLFELITAKPFAYIEKSVWASNNRYYIDGKPKAVSLRTYKKHSPEEIGRLLEQYQPDNSDLPFKQNIGRFVQSNKVRLDFLFDEACTFIIESAKDYPRENIILSFSGGKDSTVTADLVVRALGDPSLVYIFGDTTLELPMTLEYAARFRRNNPKAIFKTAKNKDQDFYEVCQDIGPPARMLRWCCSMFKTGPITRVLNNLYRNKGILSFYGIRKCESVARSKYNRIEDDAESIKIQKQKVASPIFYWKDIDIWLYIFSNNIDFNDAYRLGYDRVGCWCCPNNNERAQFLTAIYMPEQVKKWREFLVSFARSIGKPDAEDYVDTGKWKARQGGNGLAAAEDVKIRFTNCTTEDYAKVYSLNKAINESFTELFIPFGRLAPELGRKLIGEIIVVDVKTNIPVLAIQPFSQDGYEHAVKVKTLNVASHDDLQRMVSYQIKKYNACRRCLKCESLCSSGAISIVGGVYHIDENKCIHCKKCVTAKYLEGGCLMEKYLRTKV
ncbi:phosphoadenosine phosphosulfate reductase family protein [Desulfallas sp. Bu1-1]|uniref:phosphoadenosine phosphosulfate reductase domain-containing protein n=1 Tax=Desulfallas sp. Bu1-1 TaxID=2787620 RepID=UPI00189DA29B|nr:phosphoadenosine phosphosulfate reductase family protein [Desulfallas sp. Bu1-1]MBF7081862.1 phosphoadenosine phosphosulfate reductase family protein [Desulfallas sp. Bu1-1]